METLPPYLALLDEPDLLAGLCKAHRTEPSRGSAADDNEHNQSLQKFDALVHRHRENLAGEPIDLNDLTSTPHLPDRHVNHLKIDFDIVPVGFEGLFLVKDRIPLFVAEPHPLGESIDDIADNLLLHILPQEPGRHYLGTKRDRNALDVPGINLHLEPVDGVDGTG